jgi:hypothetical protein
MAIDRLLERCAALAVFGLVGCGGERAVEPAPESPAPLAEPAARAGEAGGNADVSETGPDETALDEAGARLLLAARFRAAGFRVVEDVRLQAGGVELTVDGFDPARRIGYEYVAAEERGAEFDQGARERLAAMDEPRVLVLDSAGPDEVAKAADQFLAGLAAE